MAPKTKQNYLRKQYSSAGTSAANEAVLKRKKRRKHEAAVTGGIRVVDADEGVWSRGHGANDVNERWLDDGEGEEDKPLIVDEKGDVVDTAQESQVVAKEERDASPPRRRPRHDSPQGDASPPRRRRHDSPDASPPRRRPPVGDASPPRRRRHDSPDASPPRRRPAAGDTSPPRRRRHDSPDASPPRKRPTGDASPPRKQRHDSPDASPPRRRAKDDASPPRRRRHDSPDASPPRKRAVADRDASPPGQRRRHDTPPPSGGDASPPRRRRHDTPPLSPKAEEKKPVGLKTGAEFKKELESKKAEEARVWDQLNKQEFSGQNAETIIRDRRGRELEALTEFMTQQAVAEGRAAKQTKEEYEWGRGKVQKQEEDAYKRELENIKDQPFARYENDPALEASRKVEIRTDDPMAQYFLDKVRKERAAMGIEERKVYKGPAPKPNRFEIPPGYRWDGIDRGNGFEQKWFKRQTQIVTDRQKSLEWAQIDM